MKIKRKKILVLVILLTVCTMANSSVFAIKGDRNDREYKKTDNKVIESIKVITQENQENKKNDENQVLKLTIEEAVKLGIENSLDLELVKNEIALKKVSEDRAEDIGDSLEYGEKALKNAEKSIRENETKLNEAQNALDNGILPQDIDLGNGNILKAGTNLGETGLPESVIGNIKSEIQHGIDNNKKTLETGKVELAQGQSKLFDSLDKVGSAISSGLDFSSLGSLGVETSSDLLATMASVTYDVTEASYEIYKNQIALLIQKSYYDVLKAQELLKVQQKKIERAKTQYEFTKMSYEEGMKAKDDMLVAEVYYDQTQIEYKNSKGEYENALTTLKKVLNIPLDREISLTDMLVDDTEIPDLNEGIKRGLESRLEIKKSLGETIVYDLNFEYSSRKYTKKTFQYKEAELLKEKAHINNQKTKLEVEDSIIQSYQLLKTTGEMLEISKEMTSKVKENLEIAEYKYKEGFGVETSLLRSLNLETSAGTIVEVLAAEETLAEVEEKIIQIKYGYNLAKMNYYNNIGKLIY